MTVARLIALMLGHIRMTIEQAIDALLAITSAVFPYGLDTSLNPERNMQALQAAIESMLKSQKIPINTKLYSKHHPINKCKVYVQF